MSSPSTPTSPAPLEEGAIVMTPSGRIATVLAVFYDRGEAHVRWDDGETASFRIHHLKVNA